MKILNATFFILFFLCVGVEDVCANIPEIHPLSPETHSKLPEDLKSKYPVGSRIDVLAGTTTSGYGALGMEFTTINNLSYGEHKAAIIKDFNQPDDFQDLAEKFDIVIIEGPEARNQYNLNPPPKILDERF